ncbi:MAG: C-GCAxxG-C-C family protein, partial [Saccharofermentanales bacterium]
MSRHSALAKDLFEKGYNCSQSVFAAFCDETGLDFETALKISSSFGGGLGRLREVCGAVSGMALVVGMKYGYTSPHDNSTKAKHYERIQSLALTFKERNGSYICRDLLGIDGTDGPVPAARTPQYYIARPCAELVEYAAELVDQLLND